jgi:two-component system LytT family response regulator
MPTALLVDDEASASARLGELLATFGEIEVIGAVRSVEQALAFIAGRVPDIVFLDVEMAGGSGLSLLEKLPPETEVCFVTAYPHYAVSAYDFGAVDYLVKPVDPDRLEVAVTRILGALGHKTNPATIADADGATAAVPPSSGIRWRISPPARQPPSVGAAATSTPVSICSDWRKYWWAASSMLWPSRETMPW